MEERTTPYSAKNYKFETAKNGNGRLTLEEDGTDD